MWKIPIIFDLIVVVCLTFFRRALITIRAVNTVWMGYSRSEPFALIEDKNDMIKMFENVENVSGRRVDYGCSSEQVDLVYQPYNVPPTCLALPTTYRPHGNFYQPTTDHSLVTCEAQNWKQHRPFHSFGMRFSMHKSYSYWYYSWGRQNYPEKVAFIVNMLLHALCPPFIMLKEYWGHFGWEGRACQNKVGGRYSGNFCRRRT